MSCAPGFHFHGREQVGLVEHDGHRVGVCRQRTEVAVVQRRIRVLLRLDDPEHEVGERDDALCLQPVRRLDRVEVGKIEQDEAAESVRVDTVTAADLEPVEQRVSACAPDRRLAGGRRRPAAADDRQLASRRGR